MGRRSDKKSSGSHIRSGPVASKRGDSQVDSNNRPKRVAIKIAVFALMGLFGLGSGWIAGKALTGALRPSVSSNNATAGGDANQPEPQPEIKQPQPPVEQPEPRPQPEVSKKPDPPVKSDDDQHPVERLGRRALKKILKEIEKEIDPARPRAKRKDKDYR